MLMYVTTNSILLLYITSVLSVIDVPENDFSNPFVQIGSKYYYIYLEKQMNWFGAAHFCRLYDSDLATIESADEMSALSAYFIANNYSDNNFWTSGNDLSEEGAFVSLSNGRPMPYADWRDGEPHNRDGKGNCVQVSSMSKNGFKMNDILCNTLSYALCEEEDLYKSEYSDSNESPAGIVLTEQKLQVVATVNKQNLLAMLNKQSVLVNFQGA